MHRNFNHHMNNGNPRRRPEPAYFRTSLRQYCREKWLTTIIGVIGFIAGIFLIVGNEARAAFTSKSLYESIAIVTTVTPEAEIDKSNIGKLVYVTGVMTIHEPLTEVDYGISVLAVKLFRNVQMYQWVETEQELIGEDGSVALTTYNYHTEWKNNLIDSSHFATPMGHWNPKEFPIKRQIQINENVKIGKYNLGLDLKKKFTDFDSLTSDVRPERADIKLHSGIYYHCQDIWKPEVGDVRVQFSYAGHHGQVITVVAMLDETLTLVPYVSNSGAKISILRQGQYSLEETFALEHSQNKFLTWMYRGGGWLLLYFSCMCLSNILHIVVSHSALLQDVLPVSHSSLKMTVSMCFTLAATALAWIWYRPILGTGLVFVTVFLLFSTKWLSRNFSFQPHYNRL